MASSGIVQAISGVVKAIAVDGTERILQVGDRVLPNEQIVTGDAGTIVIEFSDGTSMDLGRNASVTLNDDALNSENAPKQASQSADDAQDEVAAIQQALLDGENFDPSKLAATAAGGAPAAGGGTEDNGNTIVNVDYLNPDMTPDNGFDTTGIGVAFEDPDADFILNPQSIVVPPVISVSVDVSVDVQVDLAVETGVDVNGVDVVVIDPATDIGLLPDGSEPNIEVNTVGIIEGTNGDEGKIVNFIISLDKVFDQDVQVTYEIVPGTAQGSLVGENGTETDYITENTIFTVTIPAGETSFIVPVEIVQDHYVENNESFHIVLVSAVNATIDPDSDTATVVIIDDDIPPEANNDSYATEEDTPITINAGSGVLTNDTGADHGEVLTVTDYGQPANGTVTLNPDGSFTYTPNADFNGQDSFTYSMTDGFNGESSATVTIDVDANPDAVDDAFTTDEGQAISNTVVPNDDQGDSPATFANTTNPGNGTLVFNADGTFTYTPNAGFSGSDSFEYEITDVDGDTDTAIVDLTVVATPPPPVLPALALDTFVKLYITEGQTPEELEPEEVFYNGAVWGKADAINEDINDYYDGNSATYIVLALDGIGGVPLANQPLGEVTLIYGEGSPAATGPGDVLVLGDDYTADTSPIALGVEFTATAIDDSAALVLHSLHLPYDLAECYFSSKLTPVEREKITDLIHRRVNERIPSAYLMQ